MTLAKPLVVVRHGFVPLMMIEVLCVLRIVLPGVVRVIGAPAALPARPALGPHGILALRQR